MRGTVAKRLRKIAAVLARQNNQDEKKTYKMLKKLHGKPINRV